MFSISQTARRLGVKFIILMGEENQSPQEELATDMMALIVPFSGRVYGFRAAALRTQQLH